jgi:excinuclease UvrABC helicase subunit UvrB
LDKAGIYLNTNPNEPENQNAEDDGVLSTPETFGLDSEGNASDTYVSMSLSELHEALEKAVQEEDYEKAAKIRDEISKRES